MMLVLGLCGLPVRRVCRATRPFSRSDAASVSGIGVGLRGQWTNGLVHPEDPSVARCNDPSVADRCASTPGGAALRSKCPSRCIGCMLIMRIAVWRRIGANVRSGLVNRGLTRTALPCYRSGAATSSKMLAGSPDRVHTEGDGPVIGAAFVVLAPRPVRLSQIRAEGEDPLAVQPLRLGSMSRAERVLVSRAGAGERTLGHDRILAWPVPFALITGSGPVRAKQIAGSFRTPWCLKHPTQTE
jgi:hypothetical protein